MADRYRVSVNGWRCTSETYDNMWQTDGKRDEVFVHTDVRCMDTQGTVLIRDEGDSRLMGDTWRLPNRIKAGNADTVWGGIQSGDSFPDNATPWDRSRTGLRNDMVPPYKVWEGEVNDDTVVFIAPSLWEWDGGRGWAETFVDWIVDTDTAYGAKAKDVFGGLFPVAAPVFDAVSLVIQTVGTLTGQWGLLGADQTRPIGLEAHPDDPKSFRYQYRALTLTPALAQLASEYEGSKGRGVLTIPFVDDPKLLGRYELYVQVEKLVGTGPSVVPYVPTQAGWLWCSKCQGLFFGGLQVTSICPSGGRHATQAESGSGYYSVPIGAPSHADRQDGWSWCDKCQGLFWGHAWNRSICPSGGQHTNPVVSGSGAYSPFHEAAAHVSRQDDWRWCSACQGLFYNGGGNFQQQSVCPGGATHSPVSVSRSGNYGIPHVPA